MKTTNKLNCALIVFNDSSLKKIIFSFLRNSNILYCPKKLFLSEAYWDRELKPQTFENNVVKYEIKKNPIDYTDNHCIYENNIFTLTMPNAEFFEKQALEQKKAILKPFKSYTPGGILKKHQRAKVMSLINNNWVTYASIIKIKNEKFLRVWFFTKYEAIHKLKKYTTKLHI